MTWTEIGWVIIGLAVVLLLFFSLLFSQRGRYAVRVNPAVNAFVKQRVRSLEGGKQSQVALGDRFWSRSYPALGLHALSVSASLAETDLGAQETQVFAAGTGELALFARQILCGTYQGGYSSALNLILTGPTPYAFLAGFLGEMGLHSPGSVGLFGHYGPMGALILEAAQIKGGHPFAAAGSISAQAALFLTTRDLLIGEEIFLLPGLMDRSPSLQAAWISEDILRVLLITLLVVAAGLTLAGVL